MTSEGWMPVATPRMRGAASAAAPPPGAADALVIVAPGGQVAYPTFAPAALKGFARQYGVGVDVVDLNLLAFLDVTTPAFVDRTFDRLGRERVHLRDRFRNHPDAVDLIDRLLGLTAAERVVLHDVPARLRDPAVFRHATAHWKAMGHLTTLQNLYELVWAPLRFTPGSLIGGMFGRLGDLDELLRFETPYDESVRARLDAADLDRAVIGVSAFCMDQVVFGLRIAPVLRRRAPGALLVLGGNALTESELPPRLQDLLTSTFDVVVVGDGELPLVRSVEVAKGGGGLGDIPNALYREGDRVRRSGHHYKFQFEIDAPPDFSDLPISEYLLPEPVLPFRFSNGCGYGKCTFCSESADRGPLTPRLVYREPPGVAVAAHFRQLGERHGASIFVNCSSLVSPEGAADVGDAIVAAGLSVQWMAMVRAERGWLDDDRLERAMAGGASALNFGIESFHPRLNRLMRKGINLDLAGEIMRQSQAAGVTVTIYTVANYPTETLEEYRLHLQRAHQALGPAGHITFQSLFMMVVEAPVFEQQRALQLDRDGAAQTLARMRDELFPIYLLPNDDDDSTYRWDGDRLPEKLDHYHGRLFERVLQEPLYFDRDYEIVSVGPYWEPEYNMIAKRLGATGGLPALSLTELAAAEIRLADGVEITELAGGIVAVSWPQRATFLYFPSTTGQFLVALRRGANAAAAFRTVLQSEPSAKQLLTLYEHVHRRLRHLGVVEVTPRSSAERADRVLVGGRA